MESLSVLPAQSLATPENTSDRLTDQQTKAPRPLFLYGTLCAKPLLAWAVTGSAERVDQVSPLLKPARIFGYKRVAVHNCDYPAVVKDDKDKDDESVVDGFIFQPQTVSQRRKLDDFEGEVYKSVCVKAHLLTEMKYEGTDNQRGGNNSGSSSGSNSHGNSNNNNAGTTENTTENTENTERINIVDADLYLWDGDIDKLSTRAWDLEDFIATRLEDWLDLFDGMELTGE